MTIRVEFDYEPDEPDDDDRTGMSAAEFERLMDALMPLGAMDIKAERQ